MKHRFLASLSLGLSFLIVFSFFVVPANASETLCLSETISSIEDYPDGSWSEIIITQFESNKNRGLVTGDITTNHYSSNNELIWCVKLVGSFTYNGISASCMDAYTTVTFYQSGWSIISEDTTYSGNTASNSVVLGYKVLGIIFPAATVSQSLSCDKNGHLS